MSDDLRERVARAMTAHHTIPWDEMPEMRKRRLLASAAAALADIGAVRVPEQYCAKCGAPRSNHPYRHPFVSEGRPSIEPAPVSLREAALLDAAKWFEDHENDCDRLEPASVAQLLRAIAEGKE